MMREFTREQRARALKHQRFSHDSFERLWLIIAFISSTEPRVIVYNAQHCKNAIEFSSWWRAALNVLITLVCILHIKTILFGLFFFGLWEAALKNHLAQKYEGPQLKSRSGRSGISAGSTSGLVPPVRNPSLEQSMWAERISVPRSRGCSLPPLHRSKSDQIAPLNSAPRSSTIPPLREIAPRSLKFKITLHA